MTSDQNKRKIPNENDGWRHSSVRNDAKSSFSGTMSFDDASNGQKKSRIPKFLRTQSSSIIIPTPKKSRNSTKFLGNLMQSSANDSFGSKNSYRDKNCNYSSLNNLSRLMSPSSRKTVTLSWNQSKSLRSVDHIIDENAEFRSSYRYITEQPHSDPNSSVPNLLDIGGSGGLSHRLSRYRRTHQFRRRSISWDSAENAKALKRYDYLRRVPLIDIITIVSSSVLILFQLKLFSTNSVFKFF